MIKTQKINLPDEVNIIEVGPRDGFQNISEFIPTERKIELIEMLGNSGLNRIEVTSFVNPKAVPQMKDAKIVLDSIREKGSIRYCVLVPNLRGAELALESGAREINIVISASETHNQKNVRKSIAQSFEELNRIKELSEGYANIRLRVSLATVFGCPDEGQIPVKKIREIIKKVIELEIGEIILCDTASMGNPLQVIKTIEELEDLLANIDAVLHFHNARGNGMANIFAALIGGINNFETSIGGLGGCPFISGAAGNVATEDLVNLLDDMRIKTGVVKSSLVDCVSYIKKYIKNDLDEYFYKSCHE